MKRMLIYVMLFCIGANAIALDQLRKLPSFFQHFREHQQRNSKVDFYDFLSMHYFGNDINDNDSEKDMQLPFKHMDTQHHLVLFFSIKSFPARADFIHLQPAADHYQNNDRPDPYLSRLFRPPCV